MKKKKIGIYLEAGPACGGVYQYTHLMVQALLALPKNEFQIVAIYGAFHWQKVFINQDVVQAKYIAISSLWRCIMGVWRRLKLPLKWFRTMAAKYHPLAKAMLYENCDLWIFPSQDAYAYWMPVNALTTVHDLMHRYERRFPEVGNNKEFDIREFHYRNTCRYAKAVLVDSTLGKHQLKESYGLQEECCFVLPYIAQKEIEQVKSVNFDNKYTLPKKYFFYPAQFWQHKNHQNLIKALALCHSSLHTDLSDMHVVFVGSKKNGFTEIQNLIDRHQLNAYIHILGLVNEEDIPEFYRRARALVMPTYFGPTNIPPLEAFALQCPVAISGIYAMQEQLNDAALFFDPNSIEDIADKMAQLWTSDALCQTLITKGLEHHNAWGFQQFQKSFESILYGINCMDT